MMDGINLVSNCAHCGWHMGRHLDAGNVLPWLWCPQPNGDLPDVTVTWTGPIRIITPVAPYGVWKSP